MNRIPLLFALMASACSEEEPALPFDATTPHLTLRGTFGGLEIDVTEVDVDGGEREYGGPPTPGDGEATPDYELSRLCEVDAGFTTVIDGVEWEINIEVEKFDAESFGVGRYTVVAGDDVEPELGQTASELRMDNADAHHERSALRGYFDVKVYSSTGGHAQNAEIREGGSWGAVFELEFGVGEFVEGSFLVDIEETNVEPEEC